MLLDKIKIMGNEVIIIAFIVQGGQAFFSQFAVIDLQSSKRNASVQSLLLVVKFVYNQ